MAGSGRQSGPRRRRPVPVTAAPAVALPLPRAGAMLCAPVMDLADFRRHADLQKRHDVAVQFIVYENQHARGIQPVDRDPEAYVEENS